MTGFGGFPNPHTILPAADGQAYLSLRGRAIPRAERYALGRELRARVPRSSLGSWRAPEGRRDVVQQVVQAHEGRVASLVPVRVARMAASPYAFLRGTAGIMAGDFAGLPATGITPVICGDAHLGNFGFYASPERALVFDLNDFDEAHPGSWEWDLRRLATSVWVAGRHNGATEAICETAVACCVAAYRRQVRHLADEPLLSRFFERVDMDTLRATSSARRCGAKSSGLPTGPAPEPATGSCHASPSSATACAGSSRSLR